MMSRYQRLTPERMEEIKEIVGKAQVLSETAIPEAYAYDAGTQKTGTRDYPEAVVLPANAGEIAAIMKWANRHRIPVTPRGGGSGLAGGAVPVNGGIALDLRRMNRIIHVDKAARYMVVEPAARTLDIQQEANRHGLLYAGDPCSSDDCVIAGNIATNAGGNRAVKYGVTADQVYELEIVTPQGEIVALGGRLKKNSTGYGLVKLIAGSEGTLGIITRITLKLQKLAPLVPSFLAVFPNLPAAADFVGALLDDGILDPISLEIIDRETLLALERYRQDKLFVGQIGDALIIQLEAATEAELAQKRQRLQEIAASRQCLGVDAVNSEKIWQARRVWGKGIEMDHPVGASDDIVVPVDALVALIPVLEKLVAEFHFEFRIAGHAGDGNVHLRILPGTVPLPEWEGKLQEFRKKLYAAVYTLGGRLSGEHGIGIKRKQALREIINPVELELMKSVKKAFDPHLILNPGKIFDVDTEETV